MAESKGKVETAILKVRAALHSAVQGLDDDDYLTVLDQLIGDFDAAADAKREERGEDE